MATQEYIVVRRIAEARTRSFGRRLDVGRPSGERLGIETRALDDREVAEIAREDDVRSVAPGMLMKLHQPLRSGPTPAEAGPTWGICAVGADRSPLGGEGVTVAVLDTGIDADNRNHPAFAGVNIVEKDFTGEGNGDRDGHGTHCAGTIFGRAVDGVRIGVAHRVEKALIGKVLGSEGGTTSQLVKAIQWALDSGAQVISMSLGFDFPGYAASLVEDGYPEGIATSKALEAYRANIDVFAAMAGVVRRWDLHEHPAIIVAATGNESRRDEKSDWEVTVAPPAAADGICSVGAVRESAQGYTIAPFSNSNPRIVAPGVDIVSAARGGVLEAMSGTSMATPHVAGLAALWAQHLSQAGVELTHDLLMQKLVASGVTNRLAAGFRPTDVGAGLAQAPPPP